MLTLIVFRLRRLRIVNELIKQNDQADTMRSGFAVRAGFAENNNSTRVPCPHTSKMVAKLEEPVEFFGDDFRAVILFSGDRTGFDADRGEQRRAGRLALVHRA
jgi:hypothetical protein